MPTPTFPPLSLILIFVCPGHCISSNVPREPSSLTVAGLSSCQFFRGLPRPGQLTNGYILSFRHYSCFGASGSYIALNFYSISFPPRQMPF
ncbi:hypothetical protein RRG08_029444 [Elysia crispata]|uniref:Secreted protein n=1 Tax=Elysia crispata TaxID=231223 RepID=A0AAE1EEG9_9GAST|nr:hypothetical protein RRG08_029444 [Elysia crispata]